MAKPNHPLTDDHLKALNQVIKECQTTAKMCTDCEACLLNVDEEKAKNAEQLEVATKLKAQFFPNAR